MAAHEGHQRNPRRPHGGQRRAPSRGPKGAPRALLEGLRLAQEGPDAARGAPNCSKTAQQTHNTCSSNPG
eukprot:7728471-Pyramimonas_sp.AAC.1